MQLEGLYIKNIDGKGKGVFTSKPIAEGTIIEIAPVIILPESDKKWIDQSHLYNYYFLWGEEGTQLAIALGYISIYNHSYTPNVAYKMNFEEETITMVAWQNIASESELCFNYNGDEDDTKPLWFEVYK